MTDTWSDDSDFFSMRDEDWDAYRRRVMRECGDYSYQEHYGDAPESPPVARTGPKGVNPVSPPRIDRWPAVAPLTPLLESLEFRARCEVGECEWPATYYTEAHWPGRCSHPSLLGERLQRRLVCDTHLREYERRAEKAVREARPNWFARWLCEEPGRCGSCGQVIRLPSDVLTVVRGI